MKSVILIFCATLLVVHGWPSSKNDRSSRKIDDFRSDTFDDLPAGAKLPLNSKFIQKVEHEDTGDSGLIFGQYSYFDGDKNLVIVKYSVGKDGTGYNEKVLFTVDYASKDDREKEDDSKVDSDKKEEASVDANAVNEEAIVAKILARLRPTIKDVIAMEKYEESCPISESSSHLTKPSQSIFGFFFEKVSKFEGIASQIVCDMMNSNLEGKITKTEDELISGIIFKLVTYLPEGSILDYAKKLSRQLFEEDSSSKSESDATTTVTPLEEMETTTTTGIKKILSTDLAKKMSDLLRKRRAGSEESTTTISSLDETTTQSDNDGETTTTTPSVDFSEFLSIFSNLAELFEGATNTTSEAGEDSGIGSILESFMSIFSEDGDTEDPISSLLKLLAGEESPLAPFGELIVDIESLLNLYARDAACLGFPRKTALTKKSDETEMEDTSTDQPEKEEDSSLPEVDSVVADHVDSAVSAGPLEDEQLITKISKELEPHIRDQSRSSLRSAIIEAIHNRRLKISQAAKKS